MVVGVVFNRGAAGTIWGVRSVAVEADGVGGFYEIGIVGCAVGVMAPVTADAVGIHGALDVLGR